jgi:formamidopyrimidine-DNA glycosylase
VWFSDRVLLHTHLRMNGSWQVHRPAAPWRGRRTELRALVAVPDAVAVCVRVPVVGNLYASEFCFLAGIDPRSPLHAVDQDRRRSLLEAANRLLRANLT